ncbi:MAG TPA: tRNA uridine-5-carboxymethylaminomethyl(34) synthesis GTPase MnmE, partial [Cyanobacteria bacterium UBA11367]|nr:tRNA uridine-5-carboxymethylaminomethyl(34) synthesis GTPase MnmE [Cyanobacteria bacterium UBA11367]
TSKIDPPLPPLNKGGEDEVLVENSLNKEGKFTVFTAAAINQGIDELENAILAAVNTGHITAADLDLAINQRQAAALTRAKLSLQQVQETIVGKLPLDFWSIDLRGAIQALGEITGEEVTESVLDRIFSRFCIGK